MIFCYGIHTMTVKDFVPFSPIPEVKEVTNDWNIFRIISRSKKEKL